MLSFHKLLTLVPDRFNSRWRHVLERTMSLLQVCLVLMSAAVCYGYSCTCPEQTTARDVFCSADYAALVYVQNSGVNKSEDKIYKVQTLRTYRSKSQLAVNRRHIHIKQSELEECGTKLQAGKYYIISGHYANQQPFFSRMYTTVCDVQLEFNRNPYFVFTAPSCDKDVATSNALTFKSMELLNL